MTSQQLPLPNLHCHFEPWLHAAANNRLSPAQRLTLERHLCECPFCMSRTEDTKLVDRTISRLTDSGHLSDDLQTRLVANFLDAVDSPEPTPSNPVAGRLRLAIALALVLALTVRVADPSLLANVDFPGFWETLHQLILHDPNYEKIQRSALIAAEDHLPLAALHKLANTLSVTMAWLALFLVGRHSVINLCRRHFLTKQA
jgi:hypothetical protein